MVYFFYRHLSCCHNSIKSLQNQALYYSNTFPSNHDYFLSLLCRNAEPAEDFESFPVLSSFKTLEAAFPTLFDVFAIKS